MKFIGLEKLNRILAIDYGDVRIGLAMSDLMHIIAKPYKTIKNNNHNEVFIELQNIIEENNVGKIIVGLPITLKGEHSEQTNKVISFVKELGPNNFKVTGSFEISSNESSKVSVFKFCF